MTKGSWVRVALVGLWVVLLVTGNWMLALAGAFVVELGYYLAKALEGWSDHRHAAVS